MALFKISELLNKSESLYSNQKTLFESKTNFITRKLDEFQRLTKFDVFLSHSIKDAELIIVLAEEIKNIGLSVYVDWIDDPQLDRSKVTFKTAALIRERVRNSKGLLYALTRNSLKSSWVQWELGFADGEKNGRVAILPLVEDGNEKFFTQEYLGLYPYVDRTSDELWVNGVESTFLSLKTWLNEMEPLKELKLSV